MNTKVFRTVVTDCSNCPLSEWGYDANDQGEPLHPCRKSQYRPGDRRHSENLTCPLPDWTPKGETEGETVTWPEGYGEDIG